ncbi:MAG: hypothetical protein BWX97_00820 [Firmicutes bacterium ADurb.Bin146]|nr:MAG: hypothetical protein BWX97_00820 [Firmicutes bacterium ADurb.Bin146]
MIAKEGTILRLLDGTDKKFIIPVYQRPYSWKKSNCKLLFQDLMTTYQKDYASHFFGSIVFVENDVGGCNEYVIIDGQQRITTVSLLLLAIRNYVVEKGLSIDGINQEKITKAYLTDQYAADEKKLKLKLVQGDDDAYDRLIAQSEPIENNNITVNYDYFYEELSNLDEEDLKGLYSAITRLVTVNISLKTTDGDDPQLIFESLNSTGRDLEESDKIRNYVLMKIDSKRQEKVYKNYWEKLEKKINKEELTGFIRHYLAVKTRELPAEAKLYFVFKSYREKNGALEIEDLLQDMLKYAEYYRIIKGAKIGDAGYVGAIARLNKLDVNTVTPLLFDLFEAHSNPALLSDDEMKKAIEIIEAFMIRRLICGLPTSPLNKLFVYTGDEIEKYMQAQPDANYLSVFIYAIMTKTGKSRFPNEHDFDEKFVSFELYNAKSSARKFILERLENSKSKERVAVEDQLNNGELTIEHIMPQTLTEEWKKYLGSSWELIHTKYLHTIGNLTLTAYNSDYSNLSFDKKLNMHDKGIKCSKLMLNEGLKNCSKWNEKAIKERGAEILQWAKTIWPVPENTFQPSVGEEWVSLDDDTDFTNKTVLKMVLCGSELATDNITDAYKKFCKEMYTLDPLTFDKVCPNYHASSKAKLRSAFELGANMYIETNLSSQSKMSAMKEIFEGMGFNAADDIKFLVRGKGQQKAELNLEDEDTYRTVPCGNLAYEMFKKLLTEHRLSDKDIERLMDKGYCRSTFYQVVYPAMAYSRDANMGNSDKFRYYAAPVTVDGVDYYISSQWFDESRETLIDWYKKHK